MLGLSPPACTFSAKKMALILILLVLKSGGYSGPDLSHSTTPIKAEGKE